MLRSSSSHAAEDIFSNVFDTLFDRLHGVIGKFQGSSSCLNVQGMTICRGCKNKAQCNLVMPAQFNGFAIGDSNP